MKQILIVSCYKAFYAGNFIASISKLAQKIKDKGYNTIFVFPNEAKNRDWAKEIEKNYKVYYVQYNNVNFNINIYKSFFKIFYENKNIDIIYSNFTRFDYIVSIFAKFYKCKVFLHYRSEPFLNTFQTKLSLILRYNFISNNAKIIFLNNLYVQKMKSIVKDENRMFSLSNGINLDRIIQKKINNNKENFNFLTFGYDIKVKGIDILLSAFEKFFKIHSNSHLNIVAARYKHVYDYVLSRYNIIPEWLSILEPSQNINTFYENCDCYIQASREEGYCNSVIEAAYAGLFVIGSDIPGIAHIKQLPDYSTFISENSEDLKNKMINIYTKDFDPSENIKYIKNHYSINNWADNIIKIFLG